MQDFDSKCSLYECLSSLQLREELQMHELFIFPWLTPWAIYYKHNNGILLFVFKPEPSSVLSTAAERLQASDSFVRGVQTGGHVGGWITPAVSDYKQGAQQQQLDIHSLSKTKTLKYL